LRFFTAVLNLLRDTRTMAAAADFLHKLSHNHIYPWFPFGKVDIAVSRNRVVGNEKNHRSNHKKYQPGHMKRQPVSFVCIQPRYRGLES